MLLGIWKQRDGQGDVSATTRTALGQAVRRLKGLWEAAIVLAPVLQMPEASPLGIEAEGPSAGTTVNNGAPDVASLGFIECTNGLRATIYACKLDKVMCPVRPTPIFPAHLQRHVRWHP